MAAGAPGNVLVPLWPSSPRFRPAPPTPATIHSSDLSDSPGGLGQASARPRPQGGPRGLAARHAGRPSAIRAPPQIETTGGPPRPATSLLPVSLCPAAVTGGRKHFAVWLAPAGRPESLAASRDVLRTARPRRPCPWTVDGPSGAGVGGAQSPPLRGAGPGRPGRTLAATPDPGRGAAGAGARPGAARPGALLNTKQGPATRRRGDAPRGQALIRRKLCNSIVSFAGFAGPVSARPAPRQPVGLSALSPTLPPRAHVVRVSVATTPALPRAELFAPTLLVQGPTRLHAVPGYRQT